MEVFRFVEKPYTVIVEVIVSHYLHSTGPVLENFHSVFHTMSLEMYENRAPFREPCAKGQGPLLSK